MEITEQTWLTLNDYSQKIACSIQKKLPRDWPLEIEEIRSEVYQTFIDLIEEYKDGAMSVASWCWRYGEKKTMNKLLTEYHRLKKQDTLYAIGELDDGDDDDVVKPHVTDGVLEAHKALATQLEKRDKVSTILNRASFIDKEIMKLIMEGFSYDEIAEKVGISKGEITKRMKKYAKSQII